MLKVLLISIPVLVVLLGIFLLVTLILKRKIKNSKFRPIIVAVIVVFVISAILLTIGIMLICDPQSFFVWIDWRWILLGGIVAPALLILVGWIWNNNDDLYPIGTIQIVLGICVFATMVLGLSLSHKTTYELAEPQDLNLFENLPYMSVETYYFSVVNDIDFSGIEFKESYHLGTNVIIDGNGYTWSNIEFETTIEEYDVAFLHTYESNSEIKNLSIINSSFSIIPNYYNTQTNEGYGVNFQLFSYGIKLRDVTIDIAVYCGDAEENIQSENPSFVKSIYPETGYDEENNVDITVWVD